MDNDRFDNLTRSLARGASRRQLLKALGGIVGGITATAAAGTGWTAASAKGGNSGCAHFCTANFPPGPDRDQCVSEAAQGTGPCYVCGPAAQSDGCCTNDDCTAPATCGGGGTANICGCTPDPAESTCQGVCGTVTNNCGQPVECTPLCAGCCTSDGQCAVGTGADACGVDGASCQTCTGNDTCGGGGQSGVCGCTAETCQSGQCGSNQNGCGGTIECGGCGECQECISGTCSKSDTGTSCGTGNTAICDNGNCFLTYPNCGSGVCSLAYHGVDAGTSLTLCTLLTPDQACSGFTCTATSDCFGGQFCMETASCGLRCVPGCTA